MALARFKSRSVETLAILPYRGGAPVLSSKERAPMRLSEHFRGILG